MRIVLILLLPFLAACERSSIEIHTIEELQDIGGKRELPENGKYKLVGNIDARSTSGWNEGEGFKPIERFTGTLDGNGYVIRGLTIQRPTEDNVGLIGQMKGSRFAFLGLGPEPKILDLRLEECNVQGNSNVGGLVGVVDGGRVIRCEVDGRVSGSRRALRNPDEDASANVGGVAGYMRSGRVWFSSFVGTVTGEARVGGLVGFSRKNSRIVGSRSIGDVKGQRLVGGLVGLNGDAVGGDSMILKCYAGGNVYGSLSVGGLVGTNMTSAVSKSYSIAEVEGEEAVGGLIGSNRESVVKESYSVGPVKGVRRVGGLIGHSEKSSVVGSVWDKTQSKKRSSAAGKGLSTKAMQSRKTFVKLGWDCEETWSIKECKSYPLFKG